MAGASYHSKAVEDAASLLGAQVRQARIERGWTARELADRAGVSLPTLLKVEHGDPSVSLGTALGAAVLTGVPLFYEDHGRVGAEAVRARERATLLAERVRRPAEDISYDF